MAAVEPDEGSLEESIANLENRAVKGPGRLAARVGNVGLIAAALLGAFLLWQNVGSQNGQQAARIEEQAPRTETAHYKLFVLTGQSNSLGVTSGGEADPSIGTDAGDVGIKFFWHNVVNASISLGGSGGVFTTLQEQQGGFYTGSATHWGPEIEFTRTLYRAGVRDFGVIKASSGGGGNTHWSKSAGGHMYSHVVKTVNAATGILAAGGDSFEIIGLLYLQGESDNSSEAAIAGTRFKKLVKNLRVDLNGASNMHAVIGGITAAGSTRDTVRANQAAIATSTPYIHYFETLDQSTNLHDSLHYNKAAKRRVGRRYAQQFLALGVNESVTRAAEF